MPTPVPDDSLLQTCIVGAFLGFIASAMAAYLWRERRTEIYLVLWSIGWACSGARWVVHYFAASDAHLRPIEGYLIALVLLQHAMGCYELLPQKPWKRRTVFAFAATCQVLATVYAAKNGAQVSVGYTMFVANLIFGFGCMLY